MGLEFLLVHLDGTEDKWLCEHVVKQFTFFFKWVNSYVVILEFKSLVLGTWVLRYPGTETQILKMFPTNLDLNSPVSNLLIYQLENRTNSEFSTSQVRV